MNAKKEGIHLYEDIIHKQHHTSVHHVRMPIYNRAAQFAPFAALAGFEKAMNEVARHTEQRIELDENEKNSLDEKLKIVREELGENEIELVYFCSDKDKEGGAYLTVTGIVKKIDEYERALIMQNGDKIPVDEIIDIILIPV